MYYPLYLNESQELFTGNIWVTLLVWAVILLWFQSIPLEFTVYGVPFQVLPQVPQCRDGCLNELRQNCLKSQLNFPLANYHPEVIHKLN